MLLEDSFGEISRVLQPVLETFLVIAGVLLRRTLLRHSAFQSSQHSQLAILMDVVIREGSIVLKLFSSEDEPLAGGRDP